MVTFLWPHKEKQHVVRGGTPRRVTEVTDRVLEESRPGLDEMAGIMAA